MVKSVTRNQFGGIFLCRYECKRFANPSLRRTTRNGWILRTICPQGAAPTTPAVNLLRNRKCQLIEFFTVERRAGRRPDLRDGNKIPLRKLAPRLHRSRNERGEVGGALGICRNVGAANHLAKIRRDETGVFRLARSTISALTPASSEVLKAQSRSTRRHRSRRPLHDNRNKPRPF